MKIKHLLSAAAAVVFFGACSDYDPGQSGNVEPFTDEELETLAEYDENFADRYGTPAQNHTWGFGEVGVESTTKAQTRTQVAVNRNEWVSLNKDNQEDRNLVSITYENLGGSAVPGFPSSVDGLYHIWKDYGSSGDYTSQHEAITYEELANRVKYQNVDEIVPVGDVTDEEILYVSAWFRTHQNPTSDPLDVDKFYVQTVSKDYDRQSYGSMTGETTSSWAETSHGSYINNLPIKYFLNGQEVQYDYNGNPKDPNATGSPVNYSLDYLSVQKAAGEAYEHINNFNADNTPKISENNPTSTIEGTDYRMMEYVYETGTHDFEVHSSNIDVLENNWVLKHLTFTGRDGKQYDGWYLAFDIAFQKAEQTERSQHGEWGDYYLKTRDENGNLVEGIEGTWQKMAYREYDGYYSNYIVKIIPGNGGDNHEWYRVMCEDLGNTYDFDFNDLVFDVYFSEESSQIYANVRVQAAGGTLPIYVGYDSDEDYEAHKLLGQASTSIPVNVDAGSSAAPSRIIKIPVSEANPDAVDIYVGKKSAEGAKSTTLLPRVGSESSSTPQKICVPGNTVRWTQEHKQLGSGTSSYVGAYAEGAYPYFNEWVQNPDGDYGFEGATPWTTTSVNTGMLH